MRAPAAPGRAPRESRRPAVGASLSRGGDQRGLDAHEVGLGQVLGHHGGHLGGRQRVGEGAQHLDRVVGGRPPIERRVEVGDHDVVGLERLESAGLEPLPAGPLEDQRGGGVPHGAVCVRGAPLELRRRPGRRARAGPVGLVGGDDLGIVDPRHDRVGVQAVHARERRAKRVGVVQGSGGRELSELERPQRGVLERRFRQPGGHDRAAGGRGRAEAGLGGDLKRHAEAAEAPVPGRRPRRRVAARRVLGGVLGEPDHHGGPAQLVAVAPPQGRMGG
jgi:hypothetical protein